MDDLNGLFSSSPTSPTSPGPQVPPSIMVPGQQGQSGLVSSPGGGMMAPMITPTQTMAAEQLKNKTQILNQFQQAPGRPAPTLPGLAPPSSLLAAPSTDTLTLSSSFTEPGPVEFDDNFFGAPAPAPAQAPAPDFALDSVDGGNSFFIGETEAPPPAVEIKEEEAKEEAKTEEDPSKEPEQPERKTSFWSGLWSRNKDHGSKENILDDSDKKMSDHKSEEGRGGNEQKFLGEGQLFKGKLIGVLEVKEARGDRMCQDALQELKMAIKASGEHKQRVNIQIAVDGLKIRDEKTGDCLYHHPVHKISFIAQDMTDNRAFGYVYGSPENGHRFFGIKTEKAAGQVVVAMRDLFQVVFEMKKKEIDEAKQSMESESLMNDPGKVTTSAASFPDGPLGAMGGGGGGGGVAIPSAPAGGSKNTNAIDDLLGLQTELSAIQAGIQQIDKIAPSPPMSFQTDSMMPLHLAMSPQQQQQQQQQQLQQQQQQLLAAGSRTTERKPVAVMNQNPAVTEFSTAPFLPPPPGKPGRRQDDRYAVFDNVQRFGGGVGGVGGAGGAGGVGGPQSNNILQHQSNPPPPAPAALQGVGLAGAFGDEGPPSIFSQSLAFSDGPGAVPPPQPGPAHQLPARPQMAPVGVNKSGSQDLASLFTDLDPLGTGKSKPFVDKKDFFTDSKTAMKLTGASSDSLNNVGVAISEFVDPNSVPPSQPSHYTNSVLSSSSCLSASRYSDSFWSSAPSPPRSLDTGLGASYSRPPPPPALQAESWSRSGAGRGGRSGNSLRVALPPEEMCRATRAASPGISYQPSNNYGSILELEASPRRFRKQEIPDFYTAAPDSLSSYQCGRYEGSEYDSIESNIPIPSEPPPALPKRPPKLCSSSASPPPLPPKKQSVLSSSLRVTEPEAGPDSSDIYDFIHENTESWPGPGASQEVAVSDLVRMNVVELSQKMMEGKLPAHLSGMSLFELVEFISKQTNTEDTARSQDRLDRREESSEMRPSFSDNFVAQNKLPGESSLAESQSYLPDPNLSRLTPKSSDSLATNRLPYSLSEHQSDGSNLINQNKAPGFDDDFSRFTPDTTASSGGGESARTEQYDKYAVFRELQMEEEISNAWKSPSEEIPQQPLEGESEPDFLDIQNAEIPPEDPQFYEDEQPYDAEEAFYMTEEFPSQNQTFDQIPFPEEVPTEIRADEEMAAETETSTNDISSSHPHPHITSMPDSEDPGSEPKVGNGQAVILDDAPEVPEGPAPAEPGEENTAFEDNFSSVTFPAVGGGDKSGWATFEEDREDREDRSCEFSSFLSSEEQSRLLRVEERQSSRRDSLSEDWQPVTFNRSKSTDPTPASQHTNWQRGFDPFQKRPGTEPRQEWSNAWNESGGGGGGETQQDIEEPFQSSASDSRDKVSQNSSESIFNNPFTDNFVSSSLSRAVSETPPMFEGEGQCDRISEQSFQSGDLGDTLDVFDENNSFANSNFKIQARTTTKIPNSDSVDIFKVSLDPFDDDFFK